MSDPVTDFARSQLRTFFDELKNGTRNYRTIESVLRQVTAEYRGRAVIELLQNAHDALDEDGGKIAFVLQTTPQPALLIANTGAPFREENFNGIIELGQSPKDPNVSVGNKGLGFRSVLNVSSAPTIWSSAPGVDEPAYCFRFDPELHEEIRRTLTDLLTDGLDTRWRGEPAVDWTESNLAALRARLPDAKAVEGACQHLSVYQLPLPVGAPPPAVRALLDQGYVTVIRLPIDGGPSQDAEAAARSLEDQLDQLTPRSLVFLARLRQLTITTSGTRVLRRVPSEDGAVVRVSEGEQEHTYGVWSRTIGSADDPDGTTRIERAVAGMPNRWPELRKATVALATRSGPQPVEGALVIFLPTAITTGGGALINAPFYGSLDRRTVNFTEPINALLKDALIDLALEVIDSLAAGPATPEAGQAVVDLLCSTAPLRGGERWMEWLHKRAARQARHLSTRPILLSERGWVKPSQLRFMPEVPDDCGLSREDVRAHLDVPLLHPELEGRQAQLTALLEMLGRTSPDLRDEEWAVAVSAICEARRQSAPDTDWHRLLDGLQALVPERLRTLSSKRNDDPLATARVLPVQDADGTVHLYAPTDAVRVFFRPTRQLEDEAAVLDVPYSLKDRVAYLHPAIRTQEAGPGTPATAVKRFLDGRVLDFDRSALLERVVLPAIPALPVPHGAPQAALCADLLSWGLTLATETTSSKLGALPVPARGGWVQLDTASFGPGWQHTSGEALDVLLQELPEELRAPLESAVLLEPDHVGWPGQAPSSERLQVAGVIDGLRLVEVPTSTTWQMSHDYRRAGPSLAEFKPPKPDGVGEADWDAWRAEVYESIKLYYGGAFPYQLDSLHILPPLSAWGQLSAKGRKALSDLILTSLTRWRPALEKTRWMKARRWGGNPDSGRLTSPLRWWLETRPWLVSGRGASRPLSQRWHVPAELLRDQEYRYAHLHPLGLPLARQLDRDDGLRGVLQDLGLGQYPAEREDRIDARLLEALAEALDNAHHNDLLGQLRVAWRHLKDDADLPAQVVVQTGPRSLEVRPLAALGEVYMPDDASRARVLINRGGAVLPMKPQVAQRHRKKLLAAGIRQTQALSSLVLPHQPTAPQPLADAELSWLPVVLLAAAAFGGRNPSGTGTEAWQTSLERLRRAQLVRCDEITVRLQYGEDPPIAEDSPPAVWSEGTLYVSPEAIEQLEKLAEAGQETLERADLLRDLRLILSSLPDAPQPSDIDAALLRCEIDAADVATVRAAWSGRGSWALERLLPVLSLLEISPEGLDGASATKASLTDWLQDRLSDGPADAIVEAAWAAGDNRALGRRLWELLGERAPLSRWNQALIASGEAPVTNPQAERKAESLLIALAPLLRAVVRHAAAGDAAFYKAHPLVKPDADTLTRWSKTWWELPMTEVIDACTLGWSAEAKAPLPEVNNPQALRVALESAGIDLTDPDELARKNKQALVEALRHLGLLLDAAGDKPSRPQADLPPKAWLEVWSEEVVLHEALRCLKNPALITRLAGCQTLAEVRTRLGVSEADLEKATRKQEVLQQEKELEKRKFTIAGEQFVLGADQLSELLERLSCTLTDDSPDPRVGKLTGLGPAPVTGGGGGNGDGGSGGSTFSGPSEHHKKIVGIVGEMLAWRWLQARFGEMTVPVSAWISGIRGEVNPVLPGEQLSDQAGYDFTFQYEEQTWKVEVKATSDEDSTTFDLGSSQVREASRVAGLADEFWAVLRIRGALSEVPIFEWLPNPFSATHRQHYRLSRAGMKISYTPRSD